MHSGHSAAQITLRANDRFEEASDDGAASERDELMEPPRFWSQSGRTYDYTFSLYLPRDFPIVEERLVIAQWNGNSFASGEAAVRITRPLRFGMSVASSS